MIGFNKNRKISLLCAGIISIAVIISLLFIVNKRLYYKDMYEIFPGSLASTSYVELKSDITISQDIDMGKEGFLENINIILINLPEQSSGTSLIVRLKKNDRIIKETSCSIAEAAAGEWFAVPIKETVYGGLYCIEFVLGKDMEEGTEPYLVTQETELASQYHKQMWIDGKEADGSVAVSYQLHDMIPVSVRVYISVFLLFAAAGVVCLLFGQNYLKKYIKYIIPIILLISVIPVIVVSIYSRPCVDDYNYSIVTHQVVEAGNYHVVDILRAAWETDKIFYHSWQGLYTSAFILSLQPGIFGEGYYYLGVFALLAGIYLTLYLTIRIIKKRLCRNTKGIWMWSLILFTAIVQGLPSAIEGLFWFNGAFNYMPFLLLTVLNAALMLEYGFCDKKCGYVCIGVSMIFSFIISGGNHITSFLNIMLLLIAGLMLIFQKKFLSWFSLGTALLGFWIMYRAPGTAARQDMVNGSTILETLCAGGEKTLENISAWIDLQWVCLMLLLLPFLCEIVKGYNEKKLKCHPIIVLMVSAIIIAGMHCVPYYAMSAFGAGRVVNVVWVTFLLLSVINMAYIMLWLKNKWDIQMNSRWDLLAILLCLGVCWLGTGGKSVSLCAVEELVNGSAQHFAADCDERYAMMEADNGSEIIYFDPLRDSALLKFYDLGTDVDDWRNTPWKDYYGKTVALKP